jgi:hypothetical protein
MYEATREGVIPFLRAAIESMVRIFGGSPAALLARLNQMATSSLRGIEYKYTPTGESSGEIVLTYVGCKAVPMSVFHGAAGGMAVVYDLTGYKNGVVEGPEPLAGDGNRARFRFRW